MKVPRDLGGEELAQLLKQYGYQVTRQSGSHIRITTTREGEHHVAIPKHKTLKVGTLNSILGDIAGHLRLEKQTLIDELFGGKK